MGPAYRTSLRRFFSILVLATLLGVSFETSAKGAQKATRNLGLASLWPSVGTHVVGFLVEERRQGNMDLNGDGDAFDAVVHVFDGRRRRILNLGLAEREGIPSIPTAGNIVAFGVHEKAQGNTDLNGDGDTDDRVIHVFWRGSCSAGRLVCDSLRWLGFRHAIR
jgi:hypothetical protein